MKTIQYRYSVDDGNAVVDYLKSNGFPQSKLIGSLSKIGFSNHDIDIHIPNSATREDREKIISLFEPCGDVDETDWGGIYFTDTKFGSVDIFLSIDGFDY